MTIKVAPEILQTTKERFDALLSAAEGYSIQNLAAFLKIFSEAENSLRYAVNPRITMEATLISALKLYSIDLSAIEARILKLEQKLSGANINIAYPQIEGTVTQAQRPDAPEIQAQAMPQQRTELSAGQLWGRAITFLRKNDMTAFLQTVGKQDISKLKLERDILTIYATKESFLPMCNEDLLNELKNAFRAEGYNLRINVEKDNSEIDLEKEITSFMDEFGREKINIIKDEKQ